MVELNNPLGSCSVCSGTVGVSYRPQLSKPTRIIKTFECQTCHLRHFEPMYMATPGDEELTEMLNRPEPKLTTRISILKCLRCGDKVDKLYCSSKAGLCCYSCLKKEKER